MALPARAGTHLEYTVGGHPVPAGCVANDRLRYPYSVVRGMFSSADQHLDDLVHALHPLFEAAFGAVGRVEDVGEILKSVGGGDEDGGEGGGVKLRGKIAVLLGPADDAGDQVDP